MLDFLLQSRIVPRIRSSHLLSGQIIDVGSLHFTAVAILADIFVLTTILAVSRAAKIQVFKQLDPHTMWRESVPFLCLIVDHFECPENWPGER